jgi:hypothetical protein
MVVLTAISDGFSVTSLADLMASSMLSGLLHQATINKDEEKIKNIVEAIQFFK